METYREGLSGTAIGALMAKTMVTTLWVGSFLWLGGYAIVLVLFFWPLFLGGESIALCAALEAASDDHVWSRRIGNTIVAVTLLEVLAVLVLFFGGHASGAG
jgi:hypothetical protein